MGVTVVSPTMQSHQIENDGEDGVGALQPGIASVAFNSFGTSPVLRGVGASGRALRVKATAGTGTPAIAANNMVVTLANTTRTPRKVFLNASVLTPGFHVSAVGAGTITIGSKVAPVLSTLYDIELIVLF